MSRTEVIITRYNEFINWVDYLPENIDKITVYNKGYNESFFKNFKSKYQSKINIQKVDNVGRNSHSILKYILDNYENLPDTMVFLTGSILMNPQKGKLLSTIVRNIDAVREKYRGFFSPRFKKVRPSYNYSVKDTYVTNGSTNKNESVFIKSEFANFQEWKTALVDNDPIYYVSYRGNFVVCKENVLFHPKESYQKIMDSVNVGDNLENSHFVERIWAHLFRKYSFQLAKNDPDKKYTIKKREPKQEN
jgi:hypothetical protein